MWYDDLFFYYEYLEINYMCILGRKISTIEENIWSR